MAHLHTSFLPFTNFWDILNIYSDCGFRIHVAVGLKKQPKLAGIDAAPRICKSYLLFFNSDDFSVLPEISGRSFMQ